MLAAKVDMYWHIVAAELEAGLIDEMEENVGERDWKRKMAVYRDWMRHHPERREAWEIARFGAGGWLFFSISVEVPVQGSSNGLPNHQDRRISLPSCRSRSRARGHGTARTRS